uniref:Exportin-T n=1 Tax=Percolomonas cosmopolitus TaxID=63605 RepID=A0A7S1KQA2_9EUKA
MLPSSSDLSRAILCLSDPQAPNNLKQSAFQYLQRIKEDTEHVWELCMHLIMNPSESGDASQHNTHSTNTATQVLFWCFQTLADYIQHHATLLHQNNQLSRIQDALMPHWIVQVGLKSEFQMYMKTRYAVTVAKLFKITYLHEWTQFFPNLFSILQQTGSEQQQVVAIDFFIRILKAIDEEVVEKLIHRGYEEKDQNQLIKDKMRDDCIENVARAFYMILAKKHQELTNDCLDLLPNYSDWAPIELFTTDQYADMYLELVRDPRFRRKTCDCLAKIALKGMKQHEDKLALFQKLKYMPLLTNLIVDSKEDPEFAACFAALANNTALQLLESWYHFEYPSNEALRNDQSHREKTQAAHQMLMQIQPLMFCLLSDDDEQVSSNVTQYVSDFISTLRKRNLATSPLTSSEIDQMQRVFQVVVTKCKYPDDFHFDVSEQNEYDVGFLEYRRAIISIYAALTRAVPQKAKEWLFPLLNQTVQHYDQMHWTQIEVILTLFVHTVLNTTPESVDPKGNFFPPAFAAIVKSGISSVNNPAVQYAFFDVFWRCSIFVQHDSTLIEPMLKIFVDERGMRNPVPMVRSRSRYLFLTFMKATQNELTPFVERIYDSIRDFMQFELSRDTVDPQSTVTREKYNLYEAIGSLLASPHADPNIVRHVINRIMKTLLEQITQILNQELYKNDTEQVPAFQTLIAESLGGIMFLTKAFPSKGKNATICTESKQVLVVVHQLLKQVPTSNIVRGQITTYLRTVSHVVSATQIMDDVLPILETFQNIAKDPVSTQEFIDLLQPFPYKMKRSENAQLKQNFHTMTSSFIYPLTAKVFGYLVSEYWSNPLAEVHTSLLKLHRSYIQFLEVLLVQGFHEVLMVDANQFQTLLQGLLRSCGHASPPLVRSSLNVFKSMVEKWAGQNQSFTQFCFQQIIPLCFTLPTNNNFDLEDASWYMVLGDIVDVLRTIGKNCGNSFVEFMVQQYLPSLNLSQPMINQLMEVLANSKKSAAQKSFRNMFAAQQRNVTG